MTLSSLLFRKKNFEAILAALLGVVASYLLLNQKIIIAIGLFIITFVVYVMKNPNIAVLLFLLTPLFPQVIREVIDTPYINELTIFFPLMCLAIFINVMSKRYTFRLPSNYLLPISLFLLIMLIGAYRAHDPHGSVSLTRYLATDFLKDALIISIYFFSYMFFINEKGEQWIFIVGGLFYLMIGTFLYDKVVYGYADKMHAGYIGTGNTIGNVLIVVLPLLFVLSAMRQKNIIIRLLPFLAIGVVMLSKSRGSIMALLVMSAAYVVLRTKLIKSIKYTVLIAAILIISILAYDQLTEYTQRMPRFDPTKMSDEYYDVDTSGRLTIWGNVYDYLSGDQGRFWFGGGVDDFLNYYEIRTQNHFLKVWVDFGLVGLVAILILYLSILKTALISINSGNKMEQILSWGIIFSIIGFFSIGMWSHFDVGSYVMSTFWIQLGWFIAAKDKSTSGPQVAS